MALFKKGVKDLLKMIANLSDDEKAELLEHLEEDEAETEEAVEEAVEATEEAAVTEDAEEVEETAEAAEETEEAEEIEEAAETSAEESVEVAEDSEAEAREQVTLEALAARLTAIEERLAKADEEKDKSFGLGAGFGAEGKDVNDMTYDELKRSMIESGAIVRR